MGAFAHSHEQAEDAFEDWLIHWNGLVDRLAVWINHQRPTVVWDRLKSLRNSIDEWSRRIRQLRQFYFLVADLQHDTTDSRVVALEVSSDDTALHCPARARSCTECPSYKVRRIGH